MGDWRPARGIHSFASQPSFAREGPQTDPNGLPLFGGWLVVLIVYTRLEARRQQARYAAFWGLLAILPYTGWALYGWARGNRFRVGRGLLVVLGLVVVESGLFWAMVLRSI